MQSSSERKNSPSFWLLLVTAWGVPVACGMILLGLHDAKPGAVGKSPNTWPEDTRIPLDRTLPTLIVFAHPKCPCLAASIEELNRIAAKTYGKLRIVVMFYRPRSFDDSWTRTATRKRAEAIPGVVAAIDPDGVEARRFGAATSGHVVLFNRDGVRLYFGGITNSRGHAGDNPGGQAVVAATLQGRIERSFQPVFGCPLFNDSKSSDLAAAVQNVRDQGTR
jgi:hypothetical protein